MRDRGGNEDQRSHAFGDHPFWIMDFVDQEVVAALNQLPKVVVKPADRQTSGGEQPKQPRMLRPSVRCPVKGGDQQGGSQAAKDANQRRQHQPSTDHGQHEYLFGGKSFLHTHQEYKRL